MINHLIFQIYAPFTSWGEPAVGEIRHSNIIPSRSALLGLVSAALGIRRDDNQIDHFNQHYYFAIRPFMASSSWFCDFHTVEFVSNKKNNIEDNKNILTTKREYYNDIYYQIVMSETENAPYSLAQIQQALLNPIFPLYAGRKNSPLSLPLSPILYQGTLSEAFIFADKHYQECHRQDPVIDKLVESTANEYYWEQDNQEDHFKVIKIQLRQDQPISRERWQFSYRQQFSGHLTGSE